MFEFHGFRCIRKAAMFSPICPFHNIIYFQKFCGAFKLSNGIFFIQGASGFEEKRHYLVQVKRSMEQTEPHIVLSAKDVFCKMTYGKEKFNNDIISELQRQAKSFITKTFGLAKVMSLETAVDVAKKNKSTKLPDCRTYILFNSFSSWFKKGFLLIYGGDRVQIVNYKKLDFVKLQANRWVVCKNFSVSQDGNEILVNNDETTCVPEEDDDSTPAEFFSQLYKLDPKMSGSQCQIGRVVKMSRQHYNSKGKAFDDGCYIYLSIEVKNAKENFTYRLWSTNVPNEDLEGKLVLIATNHQTVKDDDSTYYGAAALSMRVYKRKSSSASETPAKTSKLDGGPTTSSQTPTTSKAPRSDTGGPTTAKTSKFSHGQSPAAAKRTAREKLT